MRPPDAEKEVGLFKEGANLISYIYPAQNKELVEKLAARKLTVVGACLFACLCLRSVPQHGPR